MAIINPNSEDADFSAFDWELLTAHKNRSSQIYADPDHQYLRKEKERSAEKRDREYLNLALWSELLSIYEERFDAEISAPVPYSAEQSQIVMDYLGEGEESDLGHVLAHSLTDEEELQCVVKELGMLQKIMENEGLKHNDLDLRHIVLERDPEERIDLIDFDNAEFGALHVDREVEEVAESIKGCRSSYNIEQAFEEGYESIPEVHLIDGAIEWLEALYEEALDLPWEVNF